LHAFTVHEDLGIHRQPAFPRDIVNAVVELVKGAREELIQENKHPFAATKKDVEPCDILPIPFELDPAVVGGGFFIAEGEELVVHKNFNIEKPTTIVNTNAEGTRDVSILVGNAAPYVAKIDGEEVESTYADGLLSLTIPAGKHKIEIVGTHYCAFDQYSTNEEHLKSAATCAMPDVYYISCYCGKNGEETFTSGGLKDHRPYTVPAKEVTETEDGCIAHFACKSCDKVFADANCKQELDPAKVILTYTQPSNDTLMIVLITIGGLILITAALFIAERKFGIFKKKKQ